MKKQKSLRILCVLLTLAVMLLYSGAALNASAASITLTVGSASAAAGGEVKIPVTVSASSAVAALKATVSFDTSKLTLKDVSATGPFSSGLFDKRLDTGVFSYVNTSGITDGGAIVNLTFTVASGVSGEVPVTLTVNEILDETTADISSSVSVVNGKVTVTGGSGEKPSSSEEGPSSVVTSAPKDENEDETSLPVKGDTSTDAAGNPLTGSTLYALYGVAALVALIVVIFAVRAGRRKRRV